jgi:hypothetical protein
MQLRIYIYKITFDEIPHWYWGVHKERKINDGYMGSPRTHSWMWNFYTPKMQVLQFFPYTDAGWDQACELERRLIKPDLNNTLCLNERYATNLSAQVLRRGSRNGGRKIFEKRLGIHGRSKEQMSIDARKANPTPGGLRTKELNAGFFSRTVEERTEDRKLAAARTNKQVWRSLIDAFRGSASGVSRHNRARGWDPSARERIA